MNVHRSCVIQQLMQDCFNQGLRGDVLNFLCKLIVGLTCLALASCATPPQMTDFDNTRVFTKSKDEVWSALVSYFATNNIQIKTIEKDSGVIYAERSAFDGAVADCGGIGLAQVVSSVAAFNVLVIPQGNLTSVTVTSEFKQSRVGPYNTLTVAQCLSTGKLEESILSAI